MPEFVKEGEKAKLCKICKGKLRKWNKTKDWDGRNYHRKCFNDIIKDIHNFNNVAYEKYGYEKRISDGRTEEEVKSSKEPIILTFD